MLCVCVGRENGRENERERKGECDLGMCNIVQASLLERGEEVKQGGLMRDERLGLNQIMSLQ